MKQKINFIRLTGLLIFIISAILEPSPALANPNAEVEAKVREYFTDIPVMIEIAKCETSFRQFTADGETLKDVTGSYVGLLQFDEHAHFMNAWSLGMNFYTLEGNLEYARHIYNQNGTRPWLGCVPKNATIPPTANTPAIAIFPDVINKPADTSTTPAGGKVTKNLRMGMTDSEIKTVQQILNTNGFIISASGHGSPGNETNYFGALTREAVKKFQCVKISVCNGNEAATGYGRIGPATRTALNKLTQ